MVALSILLPPDYCTAYIIMYYMYLITLFTEQMHYDLYFVGPLLEMVLKLVHFWSPWFSRVKWHSLRDGRAKT